MVTTVRDKLEEKVTSQAGLGASDATLPPDTKVVGSPLAEKSNEIISQQNLGTAPTTTTTAATTANLNVATPPTPNVQTYTAYTTPNTTQAAAAQAEIQKNQAKTDSEAQLEQTKTKLKIEFLKHEAIVKKDLMAYEFELNSKLKKEERSVNNQLNVMKENRKDDRIDRQAMHQRDMIDQRKQGDSLKRFESSGNDIITGGVDLDRFTP